MPKIKKLSTQEAQKIAAGEVVERPANIVKELIENALDAGATTITIYVEQAGKKSIRVQDNGCGMDPEDARICFEHHATSKISTVDDLQSINTFGFRGEALSSIASVSMITLITKQADAAIGTQLILKGGELLEESQLPTTTGTDITITDLFYNMPARKKFLKAQETEWRHIQQLFFAIALAYPLINIKLYSEKKLLFNCPSTDTAHTRWAQLIDYETSTQLIPLIEAKQQADIQIEGVISHQHFGRYDKSSIYFFVNNRWVKDYKLNRMLINSYQNVLPKHQFPIGSIKITINPAWIDVNIHPRKEEVQFLHPGIVYEHIKQSVADTLSKHNRISSPEITPVQSTPIYPAYQPTQHTPSFTPFNFDAFFAEPFKEHQVAPQQPIEQPIHMQMPLKSDFIAQSDPIQEHPAYTIIGVYKKTYIILEQDDALVMIDQHAAHERILYEQFKETKKREAIQLLFPQTYRYSQQDIALLTPYFEAFGAYGIEVAPFSDTQIIVSAVPVQLKHVSIDELISNCLSVLYEEQLQTKAHIDSLFTKTLHADMACKAAVKAGDSLSSEQITQLITDFNKTENNFSCPHGRPTRWLIPLDTIEKKFKRDYRS